MMKRVIITRDIDQGKKTGQILKKHGFEPVLFPTIRFEPVEFDKKIVKECKVVIFTSQNAVKFFLKNAELEILKNKTVIATGEKTAKYLRKIGVKDVLIPDEFSSEGVGKLILKNEKFRGKKIAVIKPVKGVTEGYDLIKGFAEVVMVPVYKTVVNIPENKQQIKNMLKRGEVDFIIFSSPSTFNSFVFIFKNEWKDLLSKTKTAVIGKTTAKALEKKGIKPDIIPERFTMEDLIEKIKQQAD